MERDILYLPGRHHISELILRAVFEKKIPGTTGADVSLFKRLKDNWSQLKRTSFESGIAEPTIQSILTDHIQEIYSFTRKILNMPGIIDDYNELLELTLSGLSRVHSPKYKIRPP